jgi:hypothetical protein
VDKPVGGPGEQPATTLYRAVGLDELEHIRATSALSAGPGSLNGKWFAEEIEHAVRWGELLHGPGNYGIVKVEVPGAVANNLFRIEKLDGIGLARYVEADQLADLRVVGEVGD